MTILVEPVSEPQVYESLDLSAGRFRAWLLAHDFEAIVGMRGHGLYCPVATWLNEVCTNTVITDFSSPRPVLVAGDVILINTRIAGQSLVQDTPAWLDMFVTRTDSCDEDTITTRQALDLLDNAMTDVCLLPASVLTNRDVL